METDTIFAVSSGAGKAGVAVVRVSGPASARSVESLAGSVPAARMASLRSIRGRNGEAIDKGLVLWMPGPASFTGEDCVEFHVHGGRAVVAGLIEALSGLDGLRVAEAGEFARRAFGNGKLDLTEVEGLADLIDAETEAQRRQALRQLEGRAGRVYDTWRERLIGILALCEAGIDFADEDDVPAGVSQQVGPEIAELTAEMGRELADGGRGEMIRDGLTVVIAGEPNVGKSSLINALARRDVAIVSEVPGTTRDAIAVRLDLAGVPVTVVDTAGIRETADAIETEGVRRARDHASRADLVLWLVERGTDPMAGPGLDGSGGATAWIVETKVDVKGGDAGRLADNRFGISAKTGAGISALIEALTDWIQDRVGSGTESVITRARHRSETMAALAALERAGRLDYVADGDLVAEELRAAANALGRITGRIDVEDVLDAIFGQFCIGK
ncbi:tRNA uridine-5-carboxymethylaminomethyl(34) synthesis GTPase MnmE [Microbaculum marinisediminis]|uniref:tRNA modification GTPase MnmE n=1 Tax=Microbaculum marinisediminis TaxID=2931392 RepID=A0AAW5R121_9HYPH|nr:tRNA uridine-5-carboxymethylaminomethyl(34) synthesis GTPase MnmE [Microbaculum sp. A6E488]MCT8972215.1 tRNA uridine-5-carboxymethylaminomethyl(34) synthesis GTPase MnmE [Microbaculum sp. A6E488]